MLVEKRYKGLKGVVRATVKGLYDYARTANGCLYIFPNGIVADGLGKKLSSWNKVKDATRFVAK